MERCISTEREAGKPQEQAEAICARTWASRNDAVPPKDVQEAAQQGLDYRKEYGRGGTEVGIARARDLSNGENIPEDTIKRMRSFFARHEKNAVPPDEKTEPDGGPTNGWIAWQLWGGNAGKRWAEAQGDSVTDSAVRIDFAEDPIRMRQTDEGYLTGEARVARVGIQSYQDGEGNVIREYRPVSEVFSADSLASFQSVPVTMGHPPEKLVTSENAKRLSIGHVGENIRPDGEWLVMPLTITDADAVREIEEGGTIQLSGGYTAKMDATPGEYDGVTYDAIQRDIRGNHVAVVQRARAGEEARINLDAADAVAVDSPTTKPRGDRNMGDKTVTVRVDGIEYEAAPEVERHISRQDEQIQSLTGERDNAKAEAETAKARADEAEAELEKLRNERSDEAIREAARARVELERSAAKVLGDEADLSGKGDREIQEEVVKAVHSDADLSEASDVYVQARYDAAVATAQAHGDAVSEQRKAAAPREPVNDAGMSKREEAMQDMKSAYKRKDKGMYKGSK
jgi:hypothetical protein